jgi:GT2 family glycosyltransferase
VDALRDEDRPFRLLEVGANVHGDLEKFLPADAIASIEVHDGGSIAQADAAFDIVVALDVLGHVSAANRPHLLAETKRVARRAVIVGSPFRAPEVAAAEDTLDAYFSDLHGQPCAWLEKHRMYGLPSLDHTVEKIRAAGWHGMAWGRGNLSLWTKLMRAHLYVDGEAELLGLLGDVDQLYNQAVFARDTLAPVYRHFVVAARSATDLDRLGALARPPSVASEQDLLRLQERLDRLYEVGERHRHRQRRAELAALHDDRQRDEASRTDDARRLAELTAQNAALAGQLEHERGLRTAMLATRSWRWTAPFRRTPPSLLLLTRLVRWSLHRMRLEPVHDLVVEDHAFRSVGDDPQLILCSSKGRLPTGWVIISYEVEHWEQWLDLKLYLDRGEGFTEEQTVRLPFGATGRLECIQRLPNRVCALRLDPLAAPGRFVLRNMTMREIGVLQVAARSLYRLLRPSFFDPQRMLRLAAHGLALFQAGGTGALKQLLLPREQATHDYSHWVATYDALTDTDRSRIRRHIEALPLKPRISIVMPTHDSAEPWLRAAIESVRRQLYPYWELCVAASSAPHVQRILEKLRASDPRIRVALRTTNEDIAEASNGALALATGEWALFLDHDDELAEHALYMVAVEANTAPAAGLIYSDEDKLDEHGRRYDPYFKPDWNPDLFLAQNLVTHLCACRTDLVRQARGFRSGYEGAQDWDLVMRIVERIPPSHIRHIPHVLYHRRASAGSNALATNGQHHVRSAQRKTLASHFERIGQRVEIVPTADVYWRVKYPLPELSPLVSLIIPTRDRADLLRRCVDSITRKTTYRHFELIILDNQSRDPQTLVYLEELAMRANCRILRFDAPFNYAAINNFGVRHARGEVLGLINNDIEVISPDWLDEMVSQALRPEIGAVGAMLYYPQDTIQHAGVILGLGGIAAHAYSHRPRGYAGQMSRARLVQNLSAVTGACLVIRRSVFEETGGLDADHLPIAYNDIDLCLRIQARGYRNLWTPYAELYHDESASRGYDREPDKRARFQREIDYMMRPWGGLLRNDPAYNPNLALDRESFTVTFRPRTTRPWLEQGL